MMHLKLTVGQVLAGLGVGLPMLVGTVTYVNTTFQTKADALRDRTETALEIQELRTQFNKQGDLITATYGDVRNIRGILEAQMAEKNARANP
jgi:hypothetical protein